MMFVTSAWATKILAREEKKIGSSDFLDKNL